MKITYLVPTEQYNTKMSRVRFHQIKAIAKKCDLVWSGVGWPNYDPTLSVQDNLLKIYNGGLPDLVIVFDHRPLIGLTQTTVPTCTIMNEMHDPDGFRGNALKLIVDNDYKLVICHHENEMNNPYFKSVRHRCHHLPHCADADIFKDYGHQKEVDILLVGNIRFEKYELRRRMPKMIEMLQAKGVNAQIHKHPGGFHDDSHTDRYLVDFAHAINKAKICITCSSIYKCAFGKYAEIPMCRSLVAADMPDERHDIFKNYMWAINDQDTDERIVDGLMILLKRPDVIHKMTEYGYEYSHNNYTMDHYADRFLAVAEEFLIRERYRYKGKILL